jgi:hypothetical protein
MDAAAIQWTALVLLAVLAAGSVLAPLIDRRLAARQQSPEEDD